jgi:hypothetical protein
MRHLVAAALLVTAACQTDPDAGTDALDGFVAELASTSPSAPPPLEPPRFGGCADVSLWASNSADTVGLHVYAPDLIVQSQQSAATTLTHAYSFDLPSTEVTLSFEVGTDITVNDCNDVFFPTTIRQTWVPVAGEAHVVIDLLGGPIQPWYNPALATLTLTDVVVEETTTGRRRSLPDMVLTDVDVGWLPG